tara:strand:+ start:4894 stop:6180 length:1287 start_codon:yes stop_codon:yes gene_type:complete
VKASLAARIFRTTLAIGLINAALTLVATEWIYEDIEETNLNISLAEERAFFQQRIEASARVQSWSSALLQVHYVPDTAVNTALPPLFAGLPVPFAAEVDADNETHLVSIERTESPPGVLYLAQDITVLENREDLLQQAGIIVLALAMLVLSLILARIGTGRIVRPLRNLSRQIATRKPGVDLGLIRTDYADQELADIVRVLNDLLAALEAYIHREKAMVSLASHELRTPIAVISGALDVLEQRATLSEADQKTIARIRRAADKMQADVAALLKLAHRSDSMEKADQLDTNACVSAVIGELENSAPENAGRVTIVSTEPAPSVHADPALVHMLLRNLIQNALRHTQGQVSVRLGHDGLRVVDAGTGLPPHIHDRLNERQSKNEVPEDGLGLFIVGLICERLGWTLRVCKSGATGTEVELLYRAGPKSSV